MGRTASALQSFSLRKHSHIRLHRLVRGGKLWCISGSFSIRTPWLPGPPPLAPPSQGGERKGSRPPTVSDETSPANRLGRSLALPESGDGIETRGSRCQGGCFNQDRLAVDEHEDVAVEGDDVARAMPMAAAGLAVEIEAGDGRAAHGAARKR